MITIIEQHATGVDVAQIERDVACILDQLGYADFDIAFMLTDNDTMQEYNFKFRGKNEPTDILSFPFYPDLCPGERIQSIDEDERNLGDVIISLDRVYHDARELGQSFELRMRILLVHGVCHLLGYDHHTDEEYAEMYDI